MYKIWKKDFYVHTFSEWLKEMVWTYFVLKMFPMAIDMGYTVEEIRNKGICPYCGSKVENIEIYGEL